jgi:flagellar biosynthesis/type III secretory pathway ATPase
MITSQVQQNTTATASGSVINFEKFHAALQDVSLMNCQGLVVRVSGMTIESSGPNVGLGELCRINISGGKSVLAEVVGFQDGRLLLLPAHSSQRRCSWSRTQRFGRTD